MSNNPRNHKPNICFDCQNSVPNGEDRGCPWSERLEPVPGWTAKKIVRDINWHPFETYEITACPLFVADERREYYGKDK